MDKPDVRVGVVGVGQIGADHARRVEASGLGVVAGVTDINASHAKAVAARLRDAKVFDTPEALVASHDVDAVVVTTPGDLHEECVIACIEADKPVFCEKPLATTAAACRRIVDAECAKGRRFTQVGFMRRYDPPYVSMQRTLKSGALGEPLFVHCVARSPSVPETFTTEMMITDAAIHELDLVRWLLDREIVAVQVMKARRSKRGHAELNDALLLVLQLEGGVLADVEVFLNASYGYDIRCETVGESGAVSLAETSDLVVAGDGTRGYAVPAGWKERFGHAYDIEVRAWVEAAAAQRTTGPTAWDGYASAVAAESCLESLRTSSQCDLPVLEVPSLYVSRADGQQLKVVDVTSGFNRAS